MLAQLAHRLRTTNEQVAEIGLLDVGVADRAAAVAAVLGRRARGAAPGARLRVNQGELAAELGVTRESVNKHLARWKAKGAIAIESGVVVLLKPEVLRGAE